MMNEDFKTLLKRIFRKDSLSRVFSVARLVSLIAGAGIASVYLLTNGSIIASIVCGVVAFVLFRYGQIKSYLP